MGDLGKRIPKPLWPLFESTLLEVQSFYASHLGLKSQIINTHHLAEKFNSHFSNKNGFSIFFEEELLGSGGCFHNLIKNGVSGDIFIFNPDSFLILSKKDWENFFKLSKAQDQVLIAIPCKKADPYNRFVTEGTVLKEIVPPHEKAPKWTYSGFGKVSLDTLKGSSGPSGFFDTVAKLDTDSLHVFYPTEDYEFWDFGTLESYKENVFELINDASSRLGELLRESNLIDPSKVRGSSYNSDTEQVINFTGGFCGETLPGIYIGKEEVSRI
jgi:mannose-1-phosphate guanylyltransferase